MLSFSSQYRVLAAAVTLGMFSSMPIQSVHAQTADGVYYGAFGGIGAGSMRSHDGLVELNPVGSVIGGRIGYSKKVNSWYVAGEADFALSSLEGTERVTISGYETAFDSDHDYLGTLRARLGRQLGQGLVFVTGGIALSESEGIVSVRGPDNQQIGTTAKDVSDHLGFTIGAGLELPITKRISFTGEIMRVDFKKEELTFDIGVHAEPMREEAHFDANIIRIGFNIRR